MRCIWVAFKTLLSLFSGLLIAVFQHGLLGPFRLLPPIDRWQEPFSQPPDLVLVKVIRVQIVLNPQPPAIDHGSEFINLFRKFREPFLIICQLIRIPEFFERLGDGVESLLNVR